MFCGEITTNRRRLYRFRVFRIADLKTSQTKRFRGKFAKHGNKKNNSFRNIISYNSANAGEMSGLEMSVTNIMRNVYIDCINNVKLRANKVASKDSYYTCSRQLRMTCAGDKTTTEGYRIIDVLTF